MIDLSKLTPAPWRDTEALDGPFVAYGSNPVTTTGFLSPEDAAFIALSRNAFDVMMRRKWNPIFLVGPDGPSWCVHDGNDLILDGAADPYTALVEADKWYTEHVEKVPT